MKPINVSLAYVDDKYLINYDSMEKRVIKAHKDVLDKTGKGNDFLGWLDLPLRMDNDLVRIKKTAKTIQASSEVLLVIGIGGSYLGAKAVMEALGGYFEKSKTEVIFVGHHLSAAYIASLKNYLSNKTFSINVISKSGTTTEPAIAFRVFRKVLEDRVGKAEAAKRIIATTDAEKGALRRLADLEGYETYVIDDNVGGRYSVFSPVGLLPVAAASLDVDALLQGARDAYRDLNDKDINQGLYQYVAMRNLLYEQGKKTELFVYYEPSLQYVGEWWKQLFGESEGKDGKGLFVSSAGFTTDLHSLGQYIQDGERHLFETVVSIKEPVNPLTVVSDQNDLDGLNYLAGMKIDEVNKQAMLGTLVAHTDGDVPNIVLELAKLDAYHVGYLLYFYELACAVSGYVLGVNPFDQPGVEAYKKNMFALLEKPGFEEAGKALKKRIK